MRDRIVAIPYFIPGTTAANHVMYCELPFQWTLLGVKACAINDSDATLALSGAATISAAVIGDGNPVYIQPTAPAHIDADELLVLTLDYDGSAGTAAQQVSICVIGVVGEG